MPLRTTVAVALALSAALSGSPTPTQSATLAPKAQTVKGYVQSYFADEPIMVAIAGCESHFRQYDQNGNTYRGEVNNQDVGVMQINEHYHLDNAKKLGYDIYTLDGNAAYAKYLYEKESTAPWNSSSACWNKAKNELASVAK